MRLQPGWIRQILDRLQASGVITGDNSYDNHSVEKVVTNNKLDKENHSVSPHIMEVDKTLQNCNELNLIECTMRKLMTENNRAVEPYDFYSDDRNIATQAAGMVLNVEKIYSIMLLSNKEFEGKSCQNCYFKYRMHMLVERLTHAQLPVKTCLDCVPESREYLLIGMRKMLERTLPQKGGKEEKQRVKHMVALGARVNGKTYLLSKERDGPVKSGAIKSKNGLFLIELGEFVYEGGLVDLQVFVMKSVVRKPDELYELLRNSDLRLVSVEIDKIYAQEESNGKLSNIFGMNSKLYEDLLRMAYPNDTHYGKERKSVKIKDDINPKKTSKRAKKDEKQEKSWFTDLSGEDWMKIGAYVFGLFILTFTTFKLIQPHKEKSGKSNRLEDIPVF